MTRSSSAVALVLAAGLLALPAAGAGAQITTGLTPPPTRVQLEARAAAESTVVALRDSVAVTERRDMRAWVDSAARSLEAGGAAVTPMPDVPGDSLVPDSPAAPPAPAAPNAPRVPSVNPSPVIPPGGERPAAPPTAPTAPRTTPPPTTDVREGVPAPDTATPLPALLLAAAGLAGGGAALLRRR